MSRLDYKGPFPATQNYGGIVIAFVSSAAGTGKTSLVALITQLLRFNNINLNCLIIEAAFSWDLNYYLNPNLKVTHPGDHELNQFLEEKNRENWDDEVDWREYRIELNEKLHIIPSAFLSSPIANISSSIASLIGEARREYDVIILDTPSGPLKNSMALLSAVNHILVPFSLDSWKPQINSLWWDNFQISQMKIESHPIAISGIIPVTRKIDFRPMFSGEFAALEDLFGQLVWPTYIFGKSLDDFVQGLQQPQYVSKFQDFLEKLISLTSKRPKIIRYEKRKRDAFIYPEVILEILRHNDNPNGFSYESAAQHMSSKYGEGIVKKYMIQRALEIGVTGNKTPCQCEDVFRRHIASMQK